MRPLFRTVLSLAICASFLAAQGGREGGQRGQRGGPGGSGMERMVSELNLTEGQQQQLKPIFEQQAAKMKEIRENTSLDETARRAQMNTLREQTQTQVNSVLNDEQKQKFGEMRQRGPGGGGRRGGGQRSPNQNPNQ